MILPKFLLNMKWSYIHDHNYNHNLYLKKFNNFVKSLESFKLFFGKTPDNIKINTNIIFFSKITNKIINYSFTKSVIEYAMIVISHNCDITIFLKMKITLRNFNFEVFSKLNQTVKMIDSR